MSPLEIYASNVFQHCTGQGASFSKQLFCDRSRLLMICKGLIDLPNFGAYASELREGRRGFWVQAAQHQFANRKSFGCELKRKLLVSKQAVGGAHVVKRQGGIDVQFPLELLPNRERSFRV